MSYQYVGTLYRERQIMFTHPVNVVCFDHAPAESYSEQFELAINPAKHENNLITILYHPSSHRDHNSKI